MKKEIKDVLKYYNVGDKVQCLAIDSDIYTLTKESLETIKDDGSCIFIKISKFGASDSLILFSRDETDGGQFNNKWAKVLDRAAVNYEIY